jgi:hypothetical protein
MNVTEAELRAVRPSLLVEGVFPPKPAVLALYALTNVVPEKAIASATWAGDADRSAVTWQLLARTETGLVVVTASANGPWRWQHQRHEAPEGGEVVARFVPLSRIVSVGVTDLWLWDDPSISVTELSARHHWVLNIDGEPDIVVEPDGRDSTPERHRAFFEELMAAL